MDARELNTSSLASSQPQYPLFHSAAYSLASRRRQRAQFRQGAFDIQQRQLARQISLEQRRRLGRLGIRRQQIRDGELPRSLTQMPLRSFAICKVDSPAQTGDADGLGVSARLSRRVMVHRFAAVRADQPDGVVCTSNCQ